MGRAATKNRRRPPARRKASRRARHRRLVLPLLAAAAVVLWGVAQLGGGRREGTASRPFVGGDLHSLVADPQDPARVYLGGHEAVAVSTDGGKTWRRVATLDGADAMGWAFVDGRILVGGHPGLHVSEDGGKTFERRNRGLPSTDVHALGAGTSVIYAASPAAGVFASSDGGRTWKIRSAQFGQTFMGRILVDLRDEQHLIAPDMRAGVVESSDGGRRWRSLGGVEGAMWVSWDPSDPGHVVASGMGPAAESTDGGRTWSDLDVPEGGSLVEINPPSVLFAGVHDGSQAEVRISRDGGRSWARP